MAVGTPSPQQVATPLRYRRSADALTDGQLAVLRRGMTKLQGVQDDRGYTHWAGIHGLPLPIGCDNAHGTEYFLPWHRAYLYFFERVLRDREPGAMLTWWDWRTSSRRPARIPPAFTARRVDGQPNPLYDAEIGRQALQQAGLGTRRQRTRRQPGSAEAPPLPTSGEVDAVLGLRSFLDFTAAMEGLHNAVHMWVGGHMGQIPLAAFDPIFWAHHTMVDRLWRIWQLRHPGARPPAAILDEALPPFRMTVRQTLSVTTLGYDYAVASASAPARAA
jgi:tyrosinase